MLGFSISVWQQNMKFIEHVLLHLLALYLDPYNLT